MIALTRRRYMQKKDAGQYVQDGLIFWLDGKDIGTNDGFWTDLVGGRKFSIPSGVTHDGNGFVFASGHGMMKADDYVDWNYKTCHLEVCVSEYAKTPNQMVIFDDRKGVGMALGSYAQTYLLYGHHGNIDPMRRSMYFDDKASTISICSAVGWQNGVEKDPYSNPTYWSGGGSGITIGGRGTAIPYTGTVYSVRVYNRHLTEAEVLANYVVDKERFGIG